MRIVGGIWSGQTLTSPGTRVRPTHEDVRTAWMDHVALELAGAMVLDLFAGSGALGIEALSRGAAAADFVDNSPEALHALKANVAKRKFRPLPRGQRPTEKNKAARIFKRDAIPFVNRLGENAYDIAFADPPYDSRKLDRIVERWMTVPFAPILAVEHAPGHHLPKGAHQLVFEASMVTFYRTQGA